MRAWIEIVTMRFLHSYRLVALYMRAWIEIFTQFINILSIPVALYMRAWIEIEIPAVTKENMSESPST